MGPRPSLNLVPPAPFPQPLVSDVDDIPPVIVDEADLPSTKDSSSPKRDTASTENFQDVEPLASHPHGVDVGEAIKDHTIHVTDEGIIRDSLTLGELRKFVEGAVFKTKVTILLKIKVHRRNRDSLPSRILTRIVL